MQKRFVSTCGLEIENPMQIMLFSSSNALSSNLPFFVAISMSQVISDKGGGVGSSGQDARSLNLQQQ